MKDAGLLGAFAVRLGQRGTKTLHRWRPGFAAGAACALLALLPVLLSSCGEERSDFSGLWLMHESDPQYRDYASSCWLEIEQNGDRVTIRGWDAEDGWRCTGRGTVTGNIVRFRWAGRQKGWSGRAELELVEGVLRGCYQLDHAHTELLYCCGTREWQR